MLMLAAILATSCDSYLDVNKNVDAPDKVDDYLYLASVLSAYQAVYWDIRATGTITQMMGGSYGGAYGAHYYYKSSDAAGEVWKMAYWMQGVNLENMIKQATAAERWTLAGIGYAIKAYSWDMMTKLQVDLPLEDAYKPGLLSHEYDYQPQVYDSVQVWANRAIELFEKQDATVYGSQLTDSDLIYAGDASKWKKFAHSVLVRNLASLSRKTDFTAKYADLLLEHASLAISSVDDDATVRRSGGGADAANSAMNNFWGTWRSNFSYSYYPHEYAVQVFTGTVPKYDPATGDKIDVPSTDDDEELYYPFELDPVQIICDTNVHVTGHFDPRVIAKLGTPSDAYYANTENRDSVLAYKYYGGYTSGKTGPIGVAPSFYGRYYVSNSAYDGSGRWLYRDEAPYILLTASEVKLCVAEALFIKGDKAGALAAWKEAVSLDMQFTAKYLTPGSFAGDEITGGKRPGGDKVSSDLFNTFAQEYLDGPFVAGITASELTLSHIMMQKFVALYPWGATEVWTDQRKYHYDLQYSGDVPSLGDGYELTYLTHKAETDPNRVYKGFYLSPAQVQGKRSKFNVDNEGSPAYRIRPRYNSEYMWNVPSLEALKPISGTALNYHCSIPWFAYPGDVAM